MSALGTYQKRLAVAAARSGEALTFATAGAKTGLVSVATTEQIAQHFTPTAAAALTFPVIAFLLDGGVSAPAVADTVTRDGRSLAVKVVDTIHFAGGALARLVLLA